MSSNDLAVNTSMANNLHNTAHQGIAPSKILAAMAVFVVVALGGGVRVAAAQSAQARSDAGLRQQIGTHEVGGDIHYPINVRRT